MLQFNYTNILVEVHSVSIINSLASKNCLNNKVHPLLLDILKCEANYINIHCPLILHKTNQTIGFIAKLAMQGDIHWTSDDDIPFCKQIEWEQAIKGDKTIPASSGIKEGRNRGIQNSEVSKWDLMGTLPQCQNI